MIILNFLIRFYLKCIYLKLIFIRFFFDSVNDNRNPINPVNISVIINPNSETTNISAAGTLYSVVKINTAVNSLVPKPANVIGIKPTALAAGNKSKKCKYGIFNPKDITIIYS
jgi:hypothetical protein